MTNVASRYNSYPVLVIDLGNIRPQGFGVPGS